MTDEPRLLAGECANGHLACPPHPICAECGAEQTGRVDLASLTAEVVTWTTSHATPPGVRQPNTLAIVEFLVEGQAVRVIGGTTDEVTTGDVVRPVHIEQLREPGAGIREPASQEWDGFRFEPVD
ncbi:MAG: Zn-ribbon domain-containing OB-fold protein [Salinirussus sp.]